MISRKVNPVDNKVSTPDAIEVNMRRVVVNAHVKAMISFLETVCSIVHVIILYNTIRTSYTTLLPIMSLYMIALPYAFLMNTSHNKDRVVEHGWKQVFKNLSLIHI